MKKNIPKNGELSINIRLVWVCDSTVKLPDRNALNKNKQDNINSNITFIVI